MNTAFAHLLRGSATAVHEVRRTGSADLATALIRRLFVIADAIEHGDDPIALAARLEPGGDLSDAPPPAPALLPARYCPFVATFQGQAWVHDHAVTVDDSRFTYLVSADEVTDAHDGYGEFDGLTDADRAPAEVRNWSGPFDVSIARRHYRVTGCAGLDSFADDVEGLREVLAELEPTEAALARSFMPKDMPEGEPGLIGLVGQMFVDDRRWDVYAEAPDVDPVELKAAA